MEKTDYDKLCLLLTPTGQPFHGEAQLETMRYTGLKDGSHTGELTITPIELNQIVCGKRSLKFANEQIYFNQPTLILSESYVQSHNLFPGYHNLYVQAKPATDLDLSLIHICKPFGIARGFAGYIAGHKILLNPLQYGSRRSAARILIYVLIFSYIFAQPPQNSCPVPLKFDIFMKFSPNPFTLKAKAVMINRENRRGVRPIAWRELLMQELYSEEDIQNCKKTLRTRILLSLGVAALCLGGAIVFLLFRQRVGCLITAALGMCISYFFWCMTGLPWLKYNAYLRDMREGLRRETQADFVSIADTPRYQDGVLFHEMIVQVETKEPDDDGELLLSLIHI